MKHLVFIVNPRSGVQRSKQIADAVNKYLDLSVYSYEILYTTHAGHGTALARAAAEQSAYATIAVGGDGSVNDILKGIIGSKTKLGIIPKGSGNGLARTLHIPIDTIKAIQLLNRDLTESIDIGYANKELFASNAGVGFDALVCKSFANSKKRGLAVYLWLITKNLFQFKSLDWNIKIDTGAPFIRKAFMISVANGQQLGYNFKIAADANWTDGKLDLVIIKKFPFWQAAVLGWRMYKGSLAKSRYVEHYQGAHIEISHAALDCMQTDGDGKNCSNALAFHLEKQAVPTIVGRLSNQ